MAADPFLRNPFESADLKAIRTLFFHVPRREGGV